MDSPTDVRCKICLEDDSLRNLISPCQCTGSMKYVHRRCLREWISYKHSVSVSNPFGNPILSFSRIVRNDDILNRQRDDPITLKNLKFT